MRINEETRLQDLFNLPEFAPMRGQFIASQTDWFAGGKDQLTLRQLGQEQRTWQVQDMIFGLERLREVARKEKRFVFTPSSQSSASLIAMPADERKDDRFCLLLAGGAYGAVCSLAESIPVAARLNALGMDCFCLNYRTADADSMVHGLMPQPLEDIASALCFIRAWFSEGSYLLAGFSAGGHACGLWGTHHLGARHYGLPQPEALLLAYPLLSPLNIPAGPVRDLMLQGLFGTGHNRAIAKEYVVQLHVDAAYPPVYLVRARDDTTVPARDAEEMEAALRVARIPCRIETAPSGGHGFGPGGGTPAEGWVERAIDWIKER